MKSQDKKAQRAAKEKTAQKAAKEKTAQKAAKEKTAQKAKKTQPVRKTEPARSPRPVFKPQRATPPQRWTSKTRTQTERRAQTSTQRQQRPPLHERQRRVTDAIRSGQPIQRIVTTTVRYEDLPPKPSSFNFYGRDWSFSDPRYQRTPVGVHRPEYAQRIRFGSRVPVAQGFRIGFVQYDQSFSQSSFFFGGYGYWPYNGHVYSPWYRYPQLPPYILISLVFVQNPPSYTNDYEPYRWYERNTGHTYGSLDYAISDIVAAYKEHDDRAIDRLIPNGGNVAIYLDGSYSYSVTDGDFAEMMRDSIGDVRTISYRIESVQRHRGGTVVVTARHETMDPWGDNQIVYHMFRLENERGDWVIREFGTSGDRINF